MSLLSSALTYGRMIKFSHSIFALPFAFSGAALAAAERGISLAQISWIALAMVGRAARRWVSIALPIAIWMRPIRAPRGAKCRAGSYRRWRWRFLSPFLARR